MTCVTTTETVAVKCGYTGRRGQGRGVWDLTQRPVMLPACAIARADRKSWHETAGTVESPEPPLYRAGSCGAARESCDLAQQRQEDCTTVSRYDMK